MNEQLDEVTGLSRKSIIESRDADSQPRLVIEDDKGNPKTLPGNEQPARYNLPVGANITVNDGDQVDAGDVIFFQAEEGIRDLTVTGVQTCALPIFNTLLSVRVGSRPDVSPRTLGAGGGVCDWQYLSARRLALFVAASIEQGTRWVLLEHNGPATWQRAQARVEAFLDVLAAQGAVAGADTDESHFVLSDERVNRPQTLAEGKFNLLFGFASSKPAVFDTWLGTHCASPSRVRPG